MSGLKSHLVRAQAILAAGKRVLFVEGKDDAAVYTNWLVKIDPDIQARLQSWALLADAAVIWASFDSLRAAAQAKPMLEKHRGCVHGKKYWDQVVLPALRAVENRADWLIDLADWSPVPPDLDPLLRTALLSA